MFKVYRKLISPEGRTIREERQTVKSQAAATRKVNHMKQFDAESIQMGRTVEYRIEAA
jgi:hypothetical protein